MDFLSEIIRVVTYKRNITRLEKSLFDVKENKQLSLFQGIRSNEKITDEAASELVYGCSSKEKKYLQLKSNLRKKLLNLLLQVELKALFKSKYARKVINIRRNLLIGQILLFLNLRSDAAALLKEVLKSSLDLNLTDSVLQSARHLRYCSAIAGNKKEYAYYQKIITHQQELLRHELLAEHLSNDLILRVAHKASERDDLLKIAQEYFKKMKSIPSEFKSHTISLELFRIGLRYYNIRRDYIQVLNLCLEFENYLISNPIVKKNSLLFEINANRLEACLYTRDYNKCREYATGCLRLANRSSMNWLILHEYRFLLELHTNNLESAQNILEEVKIHPQYKNYTLAKHEKWKLFEFYLLVLCFDKDELCILRIAKLLNEFTVYFHDKMGYHLSLVIIEILYYLKIERYSLAEDKIEPLKIYLYRYIKRESNRRSYYFIKMLLLLPKYAFQQDKVTEMSSKLLATLKDKRASILESHEIIPYERLWDIILGLLKENNQLSLKIPITESNEMA